MRYTAKSILRLAVSGAALAVPLSLANLAGAEPRTHDGFYMQLDTGLGYVSSSASQGQFSLTYSGVSVPFEALFGGTVGPVVIGGGLLTDYVFSPSASTDQQSVQLTDVTMYLIAAEVFADIYPDPHGGFHVRPFLGYAALTAESNGSTGNSPGGPIFGAAVGYDFWVGAEWSIGVLGRFAYAPLNLSEGGVSASYNTIAPALMASFTFH